jgi:DNA-binding transcriptional ArsR family regulator
MSGERKFVALSGLICESRRARMLWNLLDGKAYTAGELALVADISLTSASNHLSKLLEADIVKVESQGRHRYYSFSCPEVAYAVESLANLTGGHADRSEAANSFKNSGVKFCRTCYDHLAGHVGVSLTEALETKGYIIKTDSEYTVTDEGWRWASGFGFLESEAKNRRRPITRQCLDWSERKPHLAGLFGAKILDMMLRESWFRKVQFSRELVITSKGKQKLYQSFDLQF